MHSTGHRDLRRQDIDSNKFVIKSWKINSTFSWPHFLCFLRSPCMLPKIPIYLFALDSLFPESLSSLSTSPPPSRPKPDALLYDIAQDFFFLLLVSVLPLSLPSSRNWFCPCSPNFHGTCSALMKWRVTFHMATMLSLLNSIWFFTSTKICTPWLRCGKCSWNVCPWMSGIRTPFFADMVCFFTFLVGREGKVLKRIFLKSGEAKSLESLILIRISFSQNIPLPSYKKDLSSFGI